MASESSGGALFTHEPAGVILKSRFAELSTHDPTFPGQFRKPLPASRCESATSSRRCRSNTAFSSSWLIWRNRRFPLIWRNRWFRVQLASQCGEFLVNSFSFRFESLDCQLNDSTIYHLSSISQSAAFRALTYAPLSSSACTTPGYMLAWHHQRTSNQFENQQLRRFLRHGRIRPPHRGCSCMR